MANPVLLAVDDDADVLRAVARDLRRRYAKDYRILRAGSGEDAIEALDTLAERGEAVALVLSDQRMPGLSGVEVLAAARERFPRAKRVLLTAYADTEAAVAAINASRVDHYLLKPWDPPEERLYPVLDDLLADWRAGYRPGFGGVRVVGSRWDADTHHVRDFLARNQVPYQFLALDGENASAAESALEGHYGAMPLVILPDGKRLSAPKTSTVAEALGLKTTASNDFYDLVILGAGPAGLAAAVYGASEGLRTVMVEQEAPGGQAGTSSRIENYLGFPSGLSGADLARRAVTQAERFGVEILTPREAVGLEIEGPYKRVTLDDGTTLSCHALMISTGVAWRRLDVPGIEPLEGCGVYYGASMTEAVGCADQDVYLVGAGNSAGQAAMHFAENGARVTMLVRGDDLGKSMSHYLVERIERDDRIAVRLHTEVSACHGDGRLERLTLTTADGEETVETGYLFILIGAEPLTGWLDGVLPRDTRGFIPTGPDLDAEALADWPLERAPFLLEAGVPGVFVAGDVRADSIKRVASAVGEGSVAVHFIHRHLATV